MPSSERPSFHQDTEYWESCCERNGTVILACKKCDYHGEVPWDPDAAESGQWHCPQCDCLWLFLDFNRLWLTPGRTIKYAGEINLLSPQFPELSSLRREPRVCRQCAEDSGSCYLHPDPESPHDFGWGLCRYAVEC